MPENEFRQTPQAPELEEIIIGALLLEADAFMRVSGIVKPAMLYNDANRLIFETIAAMHHVNEHVDLPTVTIKLRDKGLIETIGGVGYIQQCTHHVASAANIEKHARIVAEKYIQRQIIHTATEIIEKAYEGTDPEEINQIWLKLEAMANEVFSGGVTGIDSFTAVTNFIKQFEKDVALARSGELPGLATGFPTLDHLTGGFRAGQFIVLAGRPGEGKTSLALHFGIKAALKGKKVLFFSFEMTTNDLMKILAAAESQINRTKIRDALIEDNDWNQLNQAASHIGKYPIWWVDSPFLTVDQVIAIVKKHQRLHGVDLVVIDYLQLVNSSVKVPYREQEVAAISRSLKALSISEKLPVLCLAQLNRQDIKDSGPELHHLRESGAIEQDADIVMFTWKPAFHDFESEETTIELKIAKNRNGQTGKIEIQENGEMTRFWEGHEQKF